jgi:hypothetical protein
VTARVAAAPAAAASRVRATLVRVQLLPVAAKRALGDLVAWQVAQGSEGLVVAGLTGEGPTLTEPEGCSRA